jgi:hypothetical protein
MKGTCFRIPVLGLASLFVLLAGQAAMGQPRFPDLEVKAEFMLNFSRFVIWPENAFESDSAELRFCILADLQYADAVSSVLLDKTIRRRSVRIIGSPTTESAARCHVVIIPEALTLLHREVIEVLGKRNILTISESYGFAQGGGVANLISSEGSVRIEVSWDALGRASLALDPRVFSLVEFLGEPPPPEEEIGPELAPDGGDLSLDSSPQAER